MPLSRYLILMSLTYCCLFPFLLAVAKKTSPSEVSALNAIAGKLNDTQKSLRNWGKGDPCKHRWVGVNCSHTADSDEYFHVVELQMLNMNLSGSLAPELGELSQLTTLNFMWNNLTESIPKEIGKISTLERLLLNGNKLTGLLPQELGYLTKLDRLQVDQNNLYGPIPKTFANLIKVKHLHLNNNSFTGQIPPELSKLSNLLHLLIDNNGLSGDLPPGLALLPELRIIQLDNNNFNGSVIPTEYGLFKNLTKLSFRNCNLRGMVPDFSMTTLFYLDLSVNSLSGSLPAILSSNMTTIDLSNNQFTGSIPTSFYNFSQIERLSLENNSLVGSISSKLWRFLLSNSSLSITLDLRNNNLSIIDGDMSSTPGNVTLWLAGNPVCNDDTPNIIKFCPSNSSQIVDERFSKYLSSCPAPSCPSPYEYVTGSPSPCFCALPLDIGYRLKSPAFSQFPPHIADFQQYITRQLNLSLYQFVIDSYKWEVGPRLRMRLKIFPPYNEKYFNPTEVENIMHKFDTWQFKSNHFFGPYELLNFTLHGQYSQMYRHAPRNLPIKVFVPIMVSVVICTVFLSASATLLFVRKYGHKRQKQHDSKAAQSVKGVKAFTFNDLNIATGSFSGANVVGRGGYGTVYRGVLPSGKIVAVKRAQMGSLQGENEFIAEIHLLSRLHHKHLVSLLGFCDEQEEQILVYEFMENGTLWDFLCYKKPLDFNTRACIALHAAKGILYLHTEADPPVFHRDIKSTNILLDSKFVAKVSDFGISRVAKPPLDENESTTIKGTPGYIDPEYILTDKYSYKSDVYSLGIVFLELLTGLRPISHGKNIVREVNMMLESGTVYSIVDKRMGSYPMKSMERFADLAVRCCQDTAEERPSIEEVVQELNQIAVEEDVRVPLDMDTTDTSYTGSSYSQTFASTSSRTSEIFVSGR